MARNIAITQYNVHFQEQAIKSNVVVNKGYDECQDKNYATTGRFDNECRYFSIAFSHSNFTV